MGRKKRKVSITNGADDSDGQQGDAKLLKTSESTHVAMPVKIEETIHHVENAVPQQHNDNKITTTATTTPSSTAPAIPKASNYAMTSHSGEIIEEDHYVSDGSEDEDDFADVVLGGSKVGLMRRGLHQPLLVQPTRQWIRSDKTEADTTDATDDQQQPKEDAVSLDPTERAAQLLAEKQRKLEEAKESARRLESEENAGRDPCLFSKRTAFDIRFDQIDDKPWERGAGDLTDFFNYGLTIEDWLEYAQQQLIIRQELTDASKQKRPPDPNIVPVSARRPKSQTPKVAVASLLGEDGDHENMSASNEDSDANAPVIGPSFVKKEEAVEETKKEHDEEQEKAYRDEFAVPGGVWGAPDAMLARLMDEQDGGNMSVDPPPISPGPGPGRDHHFDHGHDIPPPPVHVHSGGAGDRYDPRGIMANDVPPPPISSSREPPSALPGWGGHRGNIHGQDMDGGPPRPPPSNDFAIGSYRRGGRGGFPGRFNNFGGGRGVGGGGGAGRDQRAPPPGPPQRWGGRGGRSDHRRTGRDDHGGGGRGNYYGGRGY